MAVPAVAELQALPGLEIRVAEPMSRHTSFGIGGPADLMAIPHSPQALQELLRVCHAHGHRPLVLGNGTNVLVRDGGLRGVVIKIGDGLGEMHREGQQIRVQSGASLARLCVQAADWGLAGLSFAAGIPGTVGGAVWMNAGAWEGTVGALVREVTVFDLAGEERLLLPPELDFSYRHSALQGQDLVIVEALLELQPGDPRELHAELCAIIERRCQKQPVAWPSAGSIFKRPCDDYAGRLVEVVGGKGLRVGGAVISPKHANFIINEGGATAADVLELLEQIRERVHDQEGVWLETEVQVIGEEA